MHDASWRDGPHCFAAHQALSGQSAASLSSVPPHLAANVGGAIHNVRTVRPRPVQVAALDGVALALCEASRVCRSSTRAALATHASAAAPLTFLCGPHPAA